MKSTERLEKLLSFYEEDSNDPFTIYALATEYKKTDKNKALDYFEDLLENHPDYVGTYYHVAKLYDDMGEKAKAEFTYKKGMNIARKENNMHAFSELQQAYNSFMGLDYEDEV